MNQKRIILLLLLLLAVPLLCFAQTYTSGDEQSGGVFPTEEQGSSTNKMSPKHPETIGEIPKPEFSEELHIAAQSQRETRPNYFVLEGYVDVTSKGMRLQADRAEFDTQTQILTASGNVVLDQADSRITGDRIEINIDTQKGTVYNVMGYVPPQIFFWGSRLDKIGDDEYKLYDGVFTECNQIQRHWEIKTSTTRMTFNNYVHFRDFTMKFKDLPFFYSPYMIWPIRRERATGFLFPSFGPNSRKGFYFGDSFFWAMTRSMDSTFTFDHWNIRGWGAGAEYRISTGEKSGGSANYYYMNDTQLGPQWTFNGEVNQDLPWDFRLAGIVDAFSSYQYIQEYDNSFSGAARRSQRSQIFLTRNWSYYSLNFLNDWSSTQFSRTRLTSLHHLPELQFQARSQAIPHTPIYWTLDTAYDALGRGDTFGRNDLSFTYPRYDLFPTISYPLNYLSWLTLTPTYGYRITYWGKSQTGSTSADVPIVVEDSFTRKYSDFQLDLRGPNFSKIFDTPNMKYSQKWKHAIEPEITYHYLQNVPYFEKVLRIDDVDDVRGTNVVTYSITNLIYSKRPVQEQKEYKPYDYQYYNPKPLEEPVTSPWEFISWRLSQSYYFDSDTFDLTNNPKLRRLSPIDSFLRFSPAQTYNIDFRLDYDTYFHQLTNISVGASLIDEDKWYANVSYNLVNSTPVPGVVRRQRDSHQIRSNGSKGFYNNRYIVSGELDYDILNRQIFGTSIAFNYNDDCFGIGFEFRHYTNRTGDTFFRSGRENQITVTFTLPGIGNIGSNAPPRRF